MKRLQWEQQHKDRTLEDWKKVLRRDESNFKPFVRKRRVFVGYGRTSSERMSENYIIPTVEHDGGDVMVWGCFCGEIARDFIPIKTLYEIKSIIQ